MKIPLNLLISFISGLMAFLFGYKLGLDTHRLSRLSTSSSLLSSSLTKCPSISFERKEMENKIIRDDTKPIYALDNEQYNHKYYNIHKHHGTSVVHLVFDEYYHPSTMSKAEFIYTPLQNWIINKDNTSRVRCQEMYHTRTGSRTNQPAKCVSIVTVKDGQHSPWMTSHRTGKTAGKVDQYANDYTSYSNRKMDFEQLHPFLFHRQKAMATFLSKVGSPIVERKSSQSQHFDSRVINSTHVRRSLIVMVANEGVMNLLLNFICSCVSSGINPKSIVVFVGLESHVSLMEELGVTAMYIPEAGAMPKQVASNYGDNIFGIMMWLKVTSVYLALHSGFDVLFQDADLVWFQDPLPHLYTFPHDISFMDDGARSGRFNPYFANSGFYFMKYNQYTEYLLERMITGGVSEIHRTKSHQSVMTRYIMESIELVGLEITILSALDYPSGKMFHHNKTYMAQLRADHVSPKVFHMCWTANTQDKIKNFKSIDKWYLKDTSQCSEPSKIASFGKEGLQRLSLVDTCCVNPRIYHGTVDINEKEEENSLETEANEEK